MGGHDETIRENARGDSFGYEPSIGFTCFFLCEDFSVWISSWSQDDSD